MTSKKKKRNEVGKKETIHNKHSTSDTEYNTNTMIEILLVIRFS